MNRRIGSKFLFFSKKNKPDQASSEKFVVGDIFERPFLWVLLGFGLGVIFLFLIDGQKNENRMDSAISYPEELQGLSVQLLDTNRKLESLQQQSHARALKEDQLLLALDKIEKHLAAEANKAVAGIPEQKPVDIMEKELETVVIPATPASTVQVKKTTTPTRTASSSPPAPDGNPVAVPAKYTVQSGDTLFSIARRHEIPLARLLEQNGLKEGDVILVGQVLVLPR